MLPVLSGAAEKVWPYVRPLVEAAQAKADGEHGTNDVLEAIQAADAQLWLVIEGAMLAGVVVTEVVIYPRRKVARFWLVAGEGMDRWRDAAHAAVEAWARQLGCAALEGHGRRGWGVKLKDLGWRQVYAVYRKDLRP